MAETSLAMAVDLSNVDSCLQCTLLIPISEAVFNA